MAVRVTLVQTDDSRGQFIYHFENEIDARASFITTWHKVGPVRFERVEMPKRVITEVYVEDRWVGNIEDLPPTPEILRQPIHF